MTENKTIFWDIDTQFDFLNPNGKLYIPGADNIIDNISQTRRFALTNGYPLIASVDWHSLDDEEISENPDFKNTFPPHCLAAQPGSERVGYLGDIPIDHIDIPSVDDNALRTLTDKPQYHIVIRTNTVDMFQNPNTTALLDIVKPKLSIVFGVALDVCVLHAVNGLLRWGKTEIIIIKDAVEGLQIISNEDVYKQLQNKGVRIAELCDIQKELEDVAAKR